MQRKNKLALVSHCVLNQNSVVSPLARAGGAFHSLITVLSEWSLGIYQLPCPELIHAGMKRKPQTYEDYNTPEYDAVCREAAQRVLRDLDGFRAVGCTVSLLLGIRGSPTCSLTGVTGHLFRTLMPELQHRYPDIVMLDIPEDYIEGDCHQFHTMLRNVLRSGNY
ncbi:MAG TPA: hypothetical protein PKA28_10515 [Methylomusa anaerophila]|uniref:DUF523 domain-containing protein n=1 Tax=Methylomusa anaerophila TaxID=1930071 RepID=A0A348AIU8_9FIRM|nr:hypothetical protein [Methylomusa anaerophila]BBB90996.1 hypothetical protein MAMMFC1_01663 [Methylomusa anaerophila]HML88867.1 hypothetical protein [Methylomusa anaerophila]